MTHALLLDLGSGSWPTTVAVVSAVAGLVLALIPLIAVVAAVVVLLRHGLRGSDPGRAGTLLLALVRIVMPARRRSAKGWP